MLDDYLRTGCGGEANSLEDNGTGKRAEPTGSVTRTSKGRDFTETEEAVGRDSLNFSLNYILGFRK